MQGTGQEAIQEAVRGTSFGLNAAKSDVRVYLSSRAGVNDGTLYLVLSPEKGDIIPLQGNFGNCGTSLSN
jgi:hypothetical protein